MKLTVSTLMLGMYLAGQFTADAMDTALIIESVDEHNKYRAQENKNLPPMCWNDSLACFAEKYLCIRKKDCRLIHSCEEDFPDNGLGENLAMSGGDMTVSTATSMWYNEKSDYCCETNTCAPGKMCGHYTQMVWINSTWVGCARVECDNGAGTIVSCNYYPPGNIGTSKPFY